MKQEGQGLVPDDFRHEQYLAVADGDKNILFFWLCTPWDRQYHGALLHAFPQSAGCGGDWNAFDQPANGEMRGYAVLERIARGWRLIQLNL